MDENKDGIWNRGKNARAAAGAAGVGALAFWEEGASTARAAVVPRARHMVEAAAVAALLGGLVHPTAASAVTTERTPRGGPSPWRW